jgi:hypothetical protein
MASRPRLEESLQVRQDPSEAQLITVEGTLRYRDYREEVHGLTIKHWVTEIHAA